MANHEQMVSPVSSQKEADGARGRIESLSQKSKLEKVSSQMSQRVLESIPSGEDVLIIVNIEEPWVTRNPSVLRYPGHLEDLEGRVRVLMRTLVGLDYNNQIYGGYQEASPKTLQGRATTKSGGREKI